MLNQERGKKKTTGEMVTRRRRRKVTKVSSFSFLYPKSVRGENIRKGNKENQSRNSQIPRRGKRTNYEVISTADSVPTALSTLLFLK